MELQNLRVPPFNTTFMGMIKGALDFYGQEVSVPTLFGASGHAFLMNIHNGLCPSGPYCWSLNHMDPLIRNLGLKISELGFFGGDSSREVRAELETKLRTELDAGHPCGLLNMEFQLISGYDETGFITLKPWPCNENFPPSHLNFGTWDEFNGEIHASFFVFTKSTPACNEKLIVDSLNYALDLYKNPSKYSWGDYAVGAGAWKNFEHAVASGQGDSHGCWWNATVWSECRLEAGHYFEEIAQKNPVIAESARKIAVEYRHIGEILTRCSDKQLEKDAKLELLKEGASREEWCIEHITKLLPSIEQ